MTSKELKDRTKEFAFRIIKLIELFPKTRSADVIGKQLLRSACSVGANYRSACRAPSFAHFISKINIVEEEADESLYWLELSLKATLSSEENTSPLIQEANELTAIFTATRKTAKANFNKFKKK